MTDLEDNELLRRYAEDGSEEAFTALVQRRVNLVYAIARRQVSDAHLAEDVVQEVFSILARQAPRLTEHPALNAWLYRTTLNKALNVARNRSRRQRREQESPPMTEPAMEADALEPIRPLLDQAVAGLTERERAAVLLRCVDQKPYAEVGRRLQLSDDAARKCVERALRRLQNLLARQGVTSTAAALATSLAAPSAAAAPAGLALTVSQAALTTASGISSTAGAGALLLMSTTSKIAITAASLGILGAGWWAYQSLPAAQSEPIPAKTPSAPSAESIDSAPASTRSISNPSSDSAARALSEPIPPAVSSQGLLEREAELERLREASISQLRRLQESADKTVPVDPNSISPRIDQDAVLQLQTTEELRDYFSRQSALDYPEFLRFIRIRPEGQQQERLLTGLFQAWIPRDPYLALSQAELGGRDVVSSALRVWAELDPVPAESWIRQVPAASSRLTYFQAWASGQFAADRHDEVFDWAASFVGQNLNVEGVAMAVARELAPTSPDKTLTFLHRLQSNGQLRAAQDVALALGSALGDGTPEQFAAFAANETPEITSSLFRGVVGRWIDRGQEDNVSALLENPRFQSAELVEIVVQGVTVSSAAEDPEFTMKAINLLGPGLSRDTWMGNAAVFFYRAHPEDPDTALRYTLSIDDNDRRLQRFFTIYNSWRETDRASAEAYLASAAVPDLLRRQVEAEYAGQ